MFLFHFILISVLVILLLYIVLQLKMISVTQKNTAEKNHSEIDSKFHN